MKFERLNEAVGINPKDYTELANIVVEVFDRKNRKITGEFRFAEPLFSRNPTSKKKFEEFLEEERSKCTKNIRVRLTDDFLIVYYPPNYSLKCFFKF